MKIRIDGTNFKNKGAELMMLTTIQKSNEYFKNAEIVVNISNFDKISARNKLILKNLGVRYQSYSKTILYLEKIFEKIGLPLKFKSPKNIPPDADVLLDAGGFQFSDQWNFSNKRIQELEKYYKTLVEKNCKIVFLPQALGPFETENGKKIAKIISKYCELVYARDPKSYNYLKPYCSSKKLFYFPDITLSTKGSQSGRFDEYINKICIIPNSRMITHKNNGDSYIDFIKAIILNIKETGKEVFILNHEGKEDLILCKTISEKFNDIDIISGLNALEIKELISKSELVVSSRFHGAVSALSSNVPCIATSWNHKYDELFKLFDLEMNVLNNNSIQEFSAIFQGTLDRLDIITEGLKLKSSKLKALNNELWEQIKFTLK